MASTPNRGYPVPDPNDWVSDDVSVIIAAFVAIDGDIFTVLQSLNGKASVVHTHSISDVSGLQNALDGKAALNHTHSLASLSDVNTTGAANGMILTYAAGNWVVTTAASALGPHTHAISDITNLQGVLDGKLDVATIAAAAQKATPVDADTLPLIDSQSGNALKRLTWSSIKTTLKAYFDTLYAPVDVPPVRPGTVLDYAGSSAPAGYLVPAGQAVSRTTQATLFNVIGTTYGAGDGTTTFNLPNAPPTSPMIKIIKT